MMKALFGAPKRGRARIAIAATVAVIASTVVALPAYAGDAIAAPAGLAIDGELQVGQTLTVESEGWTPSDVTLDVAWSVDDVEVVDEDEAADPLDLTLRPEWVGRLVSAEIVAEAPGYDTTSIPLTASDVVAEGTWTLPTPSLVGTVVDGHTVSVQFAAEPPSDAALSYAWLLDGGPLDGATASSYTPTAAQRDHELAVRVTANRPGYAATSTTTAASVVGTLPDFPAAPVPVITGDVYAGQPVTADVGEWPAGTTLAFVFRVDGTAVAETTDLAGFVFAQEHVGHTISLTVRASHPDYATIEVTSEGQTLRGVFSATPAPRIDGTVRVGTTLTAVTGAWSPDADFVYEWRISGEVRSSESTFTPTAADAGKPLVLTLTASRTAYATVTQSTAPVTVAVGIFTSKPWPVISGQVRVGTALEAVPGTWVPSATFTYAWKVSGVTVSTAKLFRPTAEHLGQSLTLTVKAALPGYTSVSQTTSAVTVGYGVFPTKPKPAVAGSVRVGSVLTAVPGTWSPTATFAYAWKVSGTTVSTSKTFTPNADHKGKSLTLTVKASRTGYTSVTQTTVAVTIGAGVFTTAPTPTIAGTTRVGSTLTVSPGTWAPSATLSYQWLRDGAAISGATSSTYTLVTADWTKKISVTVTARKSGYSTTSRTSAVTSGIVRIFASAPVPTITGSTRVLSTLKASVSAWSPSATFTYQWKRNGASIPGATGTTYRLTASDYGKTITVTVTGKRSYVVTKSVTSAATAKITAPAPVITSNGMYQVGTQIKPGTYYANAPYGCYWERRSDGTGSFDGIIANAFVGAPGRQIVTISSTDRYFYTEDCGSWTPLVAIGTPATTVGDGMQSVGVTMEAGTYWNDGVGSDCYVALLYGFGGTLDDIYDNYYGDAYGMEAFVTAGTGFESYGCGNWIRIGD
jgi:hypothetical protein